MTILGVPEFAPTGSAGYLLDRYGMSPEGIADAARALLEPERASTTHSAAFTLTSRPLQTPRSTSKCRGVGKREAGPWRRVSTFPLSRG